MDEQETTAALAHEIQAHADDALEIVRELKDDEEIVPDASSRPYALLDALEDALAVVADRAQDLASEAEAEEEDHAVARDGE